MQNEPTAKMRSTAAVAMGWDETRRWAGAQNEPTATRTKPCATLRSGSAPTKPPVGWSHLRSGVVLSQMSLRRPNLAAHPYVPQLSLERRNFCVFSPKRVEIISTAGEFAEVAAMREFMRQQSHSRCVRIDRLEDRTLFNAYIVTNANDSGTGSLRQAIKDANAHLGADSVSFNIGGGGL